MRDHVKQMWATSAEETLGQPPTYLEAQCLRKLLQLRSALAWPRSADPPSWAYPKLQPAETWDSIQGCLKSLNFGVVCEAPKADLLSLALISVTGSQVLYNAWQTITVFFTGCLSALRMYSLWGQGLSTTLFYHEPQTPGSCWINFCGVNKRIYFL